MSDTPRTDDEQVKQRVMSGKPAISVLFARQLKRELNEANNRTSKDWSDLTEKYNNERYAREALITELDKLERQRNKGLETIASLAGERDELKAYNEMLVENVTKPVYSLQNHGTPGKLTGFRCSICNHDWKVNDNPQHDNGCAVLKLPSDSLTEITLRNRKAKAFDGLIKSRFVLRFRDNNMGKGWVCESPLALYTSPSFETPLEAIEAATKETK